MSLFYGLVETGPAGFDAISASFRARVSFLMAASRRSAAPLSAASSAYASSTGSRLRVYLAPLPLWCAFSRLATSLVLPVYSVPSAHERIYT